MDQFTQMAHLIRPLQPPSFPPAPAPDCARRHSGSRSPPPKCPADCAAGPGSRRDGKDRTH
jgi:hypothetical protein